MNQWVIGNKYEFLKGIVGTIVGTMVRIIPVRL